MRPCKDGDRHLRSDLPKFFDAQGTDETILVRPDVQNGHPDLTHRPAHVRCQDSPESPSQHLWLD